VESATKASLGASLIHLPTLSITLKTRINGQVFAKANKGFVIVENPYPIKTNIFLFLNLSERYPEKTLRSDAVVSAAPSTSQIIVALAPKLVKYKGIRGKTI
jgi:hypothetical protein